MLYRHRLFLLMASVAGAIAFAAGPASVASAATAHRVPANSWSIAFAGYTVTDSTHVYDSVRGTLIVPKIKCTSAKARSGASYAAWVRVANTLTGITLRCASSGKLVASPAWKTPDSHGVFKGQSIRLAGGQKIATRVRYLGKARHGKFRFGFALYNLATGQSISTTTISFDPGVGGGGGVSPQWGTGSARNFGWKVSFQNYLYPNSGTSYVLGTSATTHNGITHPIGGFPHKAWNMVGAGGRTVLVTHNLTSRGRNYTVTRH